MSTERTRANDDGVEKFSEVPGSGSDGANHENSPLSGLYAANLITKAGLSSDDENVLLANEHGDVSVLVTAPTRTSPETVTAALQDVAAAHEEVRAVLLEDAADVEGGEGA